MEVKKPFFDVELMKNYSENVQQWANSGPLLSNETKSVDSFSPLQLGTAFAVIILLFTNLQLDKDKLWNNLLFKIKSSGIKDFLYITVCLIISLLFLPMILTIVVVFKMYREYVGNKLRKDESLRFVDFMEGEDVVWVCEDKSSKSIINVLAYVNANDEMSENIPEQLVQSIRSRIFSKLMLPNHFPKMFYRRRRSNEGYFYWTDENSLTINDYIRVFDVTNKKSTSEEEFKKEMSKICSNPLPENNTALWECLICQQPIKSVDGFKIPVVFRVHHSVGDGVALLRLFLEALTDKEDVDVTEGNPILNQSTDTFAEKLIRFYVNVMTIIKSPSVLCTQILKQIDINRIHPTKLSGTKKVNWIYESDTSKNYSAKSLLTIVKLLKRQFKGARFSNILLAALSKSLRDFFAYKNYEVPKNMTVVIPARLYNSKEDPVLKLENKFSVALQTLPIDVHKIDDRVEKVKQYSDIVATSPDYLINYFMMTVVASLFPDWILKVLLNSKHASMAVSNLPGPNFPIKINGHAFESVGFFIPNIGQTACGITILSYNDKLHFGIMTDDTAVESEEELGMILNGMVNELYDMSKTLL